MKNNNIISGILMMAVVLSLILGCSRYGTKLEINGGELYYTANITADEAQTLGDYLLEGNFFDGQRKSVQLDKSGSTYQFRMVVKQELRNDKSYRETCKLAAEEFSANVFNDEQVEIHICDENFKTIRVVKP